MENYDWIKHVEEIKALYKKRRDLILKTMAEEFPAGTEWTHPEGGFVPVADFPAGCSADKVFHKCIEMKVAGVTGDASTLMVKLTVICVSIFPICRKRKSSKV